MRCFSGVSKVLVLYLIWWKLKPHNEYLTIMLFILFCLFFLFFWILLFSWPSLHVFFIPVTNFLLPPCQWVKVYRRPSSTKWPPLHTHSRDALIRVRGKGLLTMCLVRPRDMRFTYLTKMYKFCIPGALFSLRFLFVIVSSDRPSSMPCYIAATKPDK